MSNISLHHDITDLKRQILKAKSTLQDLIHEHHHMREHEKSALHAEYDSQFKQLEVDIQHKALQNSELQRRAELLMTKYQRGEKLTPELIALIHKVVDKEFASIKQRMRELLTEQYQTMIQTKPIHMHESIPKLYKELVKQLHPDVGTDPELTKKYWTSVQRAYEEKDIHALHALHTLICQSTLHSAEEITASSVQELQSELSKIHSLILKEQQDISLLKTQIPFCYALGLRDSDWISKHRTTLLQQIEKYTMEIRKSQDIIRMLTGNEWSIDQETLENTDPSIKERREFSEEFIDATYFSGRH
ncbi:MAG: hypothetical protein ACO3GR_02505 [Candidatus Kapaibacteriota bacterium]